MAKTISNPPEKPFQNTQFGGTKFVLKREISQHRKQAISKFFRFHGLDFSGSMDWILRCDGLDIALFDREKHFNFFSRRI